MGYHAALFVCGSRSPRRNFLFGLLEYEICSLCSFETSGSTYLTTHCHIAEHLVAEHTSVSSPSQNVPQHVLGKHFSFFMSIPYLRKDFLTTRLLEFDPCPSGCDCYGIHYKNQIFGSFFWHVHFTLTKLWF